MTPFPKSRRVLLAILAVAVLLVLLVTGKPAYRAVKAWRASRLVANAEQQIAKGAWHDAYQTLHAANLLAPADARITRDIARLLGERGDPQALAFLETLTQSPDGLPQDRIDLVRLSLRLGQLSTLQKHLIALLGEPETAHRSDVLLMAADWHGRCGDRTRAAGLAREALARTQDTGQIAEAKLLLARLLLQSAHRIGAAPDAGQLAEAKNHLWEVAGRDDESGLAALLLLSDVCKTGASPEEARQLGERLGRHPRADGERRLLGLTWKLRCEPEHREQILTAAIATFGDGGPGRMAAIGRWLIQQREPRRAVRLIPLAAARENKELFLIFVDALAELGRWQDLQVLLAGQAPLPIDRTIRRLYEVRTAVAMGREEEARHHWAAVRQSIKGADPETVLYVAQYAERLGLRDDAIKAYRLLTATTGAERPGYIGLIRLTEQSGDTRKLRDQMREFASRFPNEFELQNDLAYLDLLLNEQVPASLERAGQLVKRFPELLAYRTTLALAHLRKGDAAAARAVYREIETDWSAVTPGWRAVHAAALAASGDQALASAHARQIDISRLKAEERALIAGLDRLSAR